ncbi:hypothetical protein [Leisingera sp. S232]|uniref:hypothetical protein n=1 Tax=Leisingera sp. S232 TaxID=3415132 RepID=UPI003C7E12F8
MTALPWGLPAGSSAADTCIRAALQQEPILVPVNVFSESQSVAPFMRFNMSRMP